MVKITDSKIRSYLEKGFLTGSRAFGCEHSGSDYDFVLHRADAESLKKYVQSTRTAEIEASSYFDGWKLNIKDHNDVVVINIVPTNTEADYNAWKLATATMKALVIDQGMVSLKENKILRYAMFEQFVALYKIAFLAGLHDTYNLDF